MLRVLFVVPGLGFAVHSFSVMLLLACFGALYLTAWRARREGLDVEDVYDLSIWLLTGGLIGARAFFLVQHRETVHQVWDVFKVWQGGIVFYGCIAGGLIGSMIFWARRRFPFWPMADAVATALAVGIALGRLGCWLNGCCYGAVSEAPWAVTFPAGSPAWLHHVHDGLIPPTAARSLPVYPTQLMAAFDGLVLLGLLTAYYPRRRRDGEVMALLMVAYPILRFLNEGLRGDEGPVLAGLTIAQVISAMLLPCGLITWLYLSRQPRGRLADAPRVPSPARGRLHSPETIRTVRG
jgi:phosphatidylglycerol---prolipoprotein diacylglyceryl transferase